MKKLFSGFALVALLALTLAACGTPATPAPAGLSVSNVWARPSPMMAQTGAAYFVIHNNTNTPERLLAATSNAATTVEIHESKMVGFMMEMAPVEAIDIPANGQAELKPGGYHIMLIDLKQELKAGETITLTLTFEQAGEMVVTAEVKEE